MELLNSIIGYRDFASEQEIKAHIKKSPSYSLEEENDEKNLMLLFHTTKQKTWIVASKMRLYCILDDVRKERPKITWSIPKVDIIEEEDLKIEIKARNRIQKKRTGSIDFGEDHQRWLYSRDLLGNSESAKMKVQEFLKTNFAQDEME